jgi:hypothetical protein
MSLTGQTRRKTGSMPKKMEQLDGQLFVRIEKSQIRRLTRAVDKDRELHGGRPTQSTVLRECIEEYCRRIESTSESEAGRHAAKVLRRGKA